MVDSKSESEEDAFDPNSYYQKAVKDKTSKEVNEFISITLRKSLSREERKQLGKEFPKPYHAAAQVPDVLVDFMGDQFP